MDRLRRVEMKVCGLLRRASRWRHVGRLRVRRMRKLDEIQVRWIVREKAKGEMTNAEIARTMNVSTIWVKKLWARYRHAREDLGQITYPRPMGRPKKQSPGRREHAAVLAHRTKYRHGAVKLEECIEESTGLHIPHNTSTRYCGKRIWLPSSLRRASVASGSGMNARIPTPCGTQTTSSWTTAGGSYRTRMTHHGA